MHFYKAEQHLIRKKDLKDLNSLCQTRITTFTLIPPDGLVKSG